MAMATARVFDDLLRDLTDEEREHLLANRSALKEYLAALIAQMWRLVSYDQSLGLVPLIKRAVGEANLGNINRDITPERFPLKGSGVRQAKFRVEAYHKGETSENAAIRLTRAGYVLGNTGDLAGYLHDHPGAVEKWQGWVFAISEDSRWALSCGGVEVPCAYVRGACRYFDLHALWDNRNHHSGVLVASKS